MKLNDQLRQLLAMYEAEEAEEDLIAVLDDNLNHRVKIRLSAIWIVIGDGMEEDYDEQG